MALCQWDFSGRNPAVGCHFLVCGIFLTQGSSSCLLWVMDCRFLTAEPSGKPQWLHRGFFKRLEPVSLQLFLRVSVYLLWQFTVLPQPLLLLIQSLSDNQRLSCLLFLGCVPMHVLLGPRNSLELFKVPYPNFPFGDPHPVLLPSTIVILNNCHWSFSTNILGKGISHWARSESS